MYAGASSRRTQYFGLLVTYDYIAYHDCGSIYAASESIAALYLEYVANGFTRALLAVGKDAHDGIEALQAFVWHDLANRPYSDNGEYYINDCHPIWYHRGKSCP